MGRCVFPIHQHRLAISTGNKFNFQAPGKFCHSRFIGKAQALFLCGPGHGSIHGTCIDVSVVQPLGDQLGDSAFPTACWSVYRDNHSFKLR